MKPKQEETRDRARSRNREKREIGREAETERTMEIGHETNMERSCDGSSGMLGRNV